MNKMATHNNQPSQHQLQPHPHVNNKFFMNPEDAALKNSSNTSSNISPKKPSNTNTPTIKEENFENENLYKTLNDSLNLSDNGSMNLKLPLDILENANNFVLNLSNSNQPKSGWHHSNKSANNQNHIHESAHPNNINDSLAIIGHADNFNMTNSGDMQDTHASINTPPLKTNNNFSNYFGSHIHKSPNPVMNNHNHHFLNAFNPSRINSINSNFSHRKPINNQNNHHNANNNPLLSSKSFNVDSEEEDFVNWDNLL